MSSLRVDNETAMSQDKSHYLSPSAVCVCPLLLFLPLDPVGCLAGEAAGQLCVLGHSQRATAFTVNNSTHISLSAFYCGAVVCSGTQSKGNSVYCQ